MPIKLFKLRNVPEDEAEEIRALLEEHGIDFYETSAGSWGIGEAAIWLKSDARHEQAESLLESYQKQRTENARAEYARLKEAGEHRRVIDLIRERPVQFLLLSLAVLFILYITLAPFLQIGR